MEIRVNQEDLGVPHTSGVNLLLLLLLRGAVVSFTTWLSLTTALAHRQFRLLLHLLHLLTCGWPNPTLR